MQVLWAQILWNRRTPLIRVSLLRSKIFVVVVLVCLFNTKKNNIIIIFSMSCRAVFTDSKNGTLHLARLTHLLNFCLNKLRLCGVSYLGYYLCDTITHDLHPLLLFYLQYSVQYLLFSLLFFLPRLIRLLLFSRSKQINFHISLIFF